MRDRLRAIKREHRDRILSLPNVSGVGVGYKITNGVATDLRSIRVYVTAKKPPSELTDEELIPEYIDGVRTDVIEIGDLVAQMYVSRERPALGGVSLGTTASSSTGTLGVRVMDNTDGTGVILSCNHILSLADDVVRNAAVAGTPVIQPGQDDGGDLSDKIAELKRWVKFEFPPTWNQVDAAIAEIAGPLKASARIHDVGRYSGYRRLTVSDENVTTVQKTGRTTEHTTGLVEDVSYDTSYDYGYGAVQFEDQIFIRATPFSSPGDSGSAVLDLQGRLVGLIWAGTATYSVACPIDPVLEQLDISVCPTC